MFNILRILSLVLFIYFCDILSANCILEKFEKKISLDTKALNVQEFFDLISKEVGVNFVYLQEDETDDLKVSISDYKNKPLKLLFKNLERTPGFQFKLKFDKDKPYILVELNDEFKKMIKKSIYGDGKIDVNFEGATLKDVFSTLQEITGKKFEVSKVEILSKKTYLKAENIEWIDFLKKLSEEFGFNYEVKEDLIRIW